LDLVAAVALLITLFAGFPIWPVAILAGLALLAGAGWIYYEIRFQDLKPLRSILQAGLAGQRRMAGLLSGLEDEYFLLNNVQLPGRADDIDHIIVGPNGIFALETKNHRGRITWQEGQWLQVKMSNSGRAQPPSPMRDPAHQLKRNIDYLRSCINQTDPSLSRRTRLWVEGIVAFSHRSITLDLPASVEDSLPFPVMYAQDVPAHIQSHVPRRRLSKSEVRQIVSMLAHLNTPRWVHRQAAR
jgi:hypothetical protein